MYFGESIQQVEPNVFLATKSYFTNCDLPNPHYAFEAKKIWIYPNNRIAAFHVYYKVGRTSIFYWPLIFQNKLGTGVITLYGYNDNKGHLLQNTYYFNIPPVKANLTPYFFFLPQDGKLIFDYYQYSGQNFGTLLKHKSKSLNYQIDIGLANYQVKDRICEASTTASNCKQIVTNVVKREDGTIGTQNEFWWKTNTFLNATWGEDVKSYFNAQLSHYKNRNYESEFGIRKEPRNTIDMISLTPILTNNLSYNTLTWRAEYGLNWKNTHFDIQLKRDFLWFQGSTSANSKYLPQLDIIPNINFTQRWFIIKPAKNYYAGSWLDFKLNGDIVRLYEQPSGDTQKTIYRGNTKLSNIHQFYLSKWIAFTPSVSYGLTYQTITSNKSNKATDTLESERNSFHYIETIQPLRLGLYWLYFLTEYKYNLKFLDQFRDPTFKSQGDHLLNFIFNVNYDVNLLFTIKTSRDLRIYPYLIPEEYRWKPLEVFAEFKQEFLNLKKSNRKPYLYLSLSERYKYFIRYKAHGTNDSAIGFAFGNANLRFLRKLNKIYASFGWQHNFIDKRQSNAFFKFGIEIELHRDWKIFFDLDSAGDLFYRYYTDTSFIQDFTNSFNFTNQNQDTVFNIKYLSVAIEHKLHDWVIRLAYERFARNNLWGNNLQNKVGFYEQSVYLSMNLVNIELFQNLKTQVYRQNYTDNLLR